MTNNKFWLVWTPQEITPEESLALSNRVRLKSQYYQVTVFLNEITLAE